MGRGEASCPVIGVGGNKSGGGIITTLVTIEWNKLDLRGRGFLCVNSCKSNSTRKVTASLIPRNTVPYLCMLLLTRGGEEARAAAISRCKATTALNSSSISQSVKL